MDTFLLSGSQGQRQALSLCLQHSGTGLGLRATRRSGAHWLSCCLAHGDLTQETWHIHRGSAILMCHCT